MMPQIDIQHGTVWLSKKTAPAWKLAKGKGDRTFEHEITFETAYASAPKVFAVFSALDIMSDDDLRISCVVTNVTSTGFKFEVGTWGSTHVWSCAVAWLAYNANEALVDGARIESGRIPLKTITPGWKLDKGTGKRTHTHHSNYDKSFPISSTPPMVLAGFCLLDVLVDDDDHHLKISTKNINNFGFDLDVETWKKTKVWGVSVAYIAFSSSLKTSTGARIETGVLPVVKTTPNSKVLSQGNGERKVTTHVAFDDKFTEEPKILAFLSMQDTMKGVDHRIKTIPRNASDIGFDMEVATWSDSRVFGCHASWIAFTNGDVDNGSSSSSTVANTTTSSVVATDASDDDTDESEKTDKNKKKKKVADEGKKKPEKGKEKEKEKDKTLSGEKRKDTDDGSDDNICKVCMDAKVNTCLVPCGHLCLCKDCADIVRKHKEPCPICRGLIKQVVHTYS